MPRSFIKASRPWAEGVLPSVSMNPWGRLRCAFWTCVARHALRFRRLRLLVLALSQGANPNGRTRTLHDPVGFDACRFKQPDCHEEMFLQTAVRDQWLVGVEALLKAGAHTECRSGAYYETPLAHAARQHHLELARLLSRHGADWEGLGWATDPRARDQSAELPASRHVQYQNLPVWRELLEEGRRRHCARELSRSWTQAGPAKPSARF